MDELNEWSYWLIDWLIELNNLIEMNDRWIDRLNGWIEWMDELNEWSYWLIDWLIDGRIERTDRLNGWIEWMNWMNDLIDWLILLTEWF